MGNYWEPSPDVDLTSFEDAEFQEPVADAFGSSRNSGLPVSPPMRSASGQPVFPVSGSSGYGSDPPPPGQPPEGGGPPWGPEDRGDLGYYQEERYWTDYLRIAAPVLGVILMVILLWWWLGNFIGDDDNGEQASNGADSTPTSLPVIDEPTETVPASGTQAAGTPPGTVTMPGEGTEEPSGGDGTPAGEATQPPDGSDSGGGLASGATAEVGNTGGTGLNMRADATTNAEVVTVLTDGTAVTITGESVESEGFVWWPVETEDGTTGYVVEDYLIPVE